METDNTMQSMPATYPFEFSIGAGQMMQETLLQGIEQFRQSWFDNTHQVLENYRLWIEEGYDLQIACLAQYRQWFQGDDSVDPGQSVQARAVTKEEKAAAAVDPADAAPLVDDLTRIQGLGKVLQQRLRDAGVVSFRQIIAWSEADIARIEAEVLGSRFSGRITRDQWQAQAEELVGRA